MTREERLEFCSVCTKRAFNPKQGIVCSITNDVAAFDGTCADYVEDEQEKRVETKRVEVQQIKNNETINKGRYALFIVGALYVIFGFVEAFVMEGHELLFGIIDWFVAAVFIGLGVWSYKKASLALIIGLSFYILLILLLFAIEPTTIVKGIFWKVIVIYSLIYGIKTAREQDAKEKPATEDLLDQI